MRAALGRLSRTATVPHPPECPAGEGALVPLGPARLCLHRAAAVSYRPLGCRLGRAGTCRDGRRMGMRLPAYLSERRGSLGGRPVVQRRAGACPPQHGSAPGQRILYNVPAVSQRRAAERRPAFWVAAGQMRQGSPRHRLFRCGVLSQIVVCPLHRYRASASAMAR